MNIGNKKLEQMFGEDYDFNLKPSLKTSDFFKYVFVYKNGSWNHSK